MCTVYVFRNMVEGEALIISLKLKGQIVFGVDPVGRAFYTPPLKCGEVLCYTLRCLSVRPSVLTISDR